MHNKSSKEGGGGGNWAGKPASQQKERPGMRREELAEVGSTAARMENGEDGLIQLDSHDINS